jgi:hypothetical protein
VLVGSPCDYVADWELWLIAIAQYCEETVVLHSASLGRGENSKFKKYGFNTNELTKG